MAEEQEKAIEYLKSVPRKRIQKLGEVKPLKDVHFYHEEFGHKPSISDINLSQTLEPKRMQRNRTGSYNTIDGGNLKKHLSLQ